MIYKMKDFFFVILLRSYFKALIGGVCLSLALTLSGCHTSQRDLPAGSAWLSPRVSVGLPPLHNMPSIQLQQLLTARYADQEHSLIALLEVNEKSLVLMGLSTLGIRLFSFTYDEKGVEAKVYVTTVQESLAPEQVLLDIMLAYSPIEAWQEVLPIGWRLVDEQNKRMLFDAQGELVTEIFYVLEETRRSPVLLRRYSFHYEIKIELLDVF